MTVETASPYRGLAAFGDSDLDARLFFGRERETEIVAANLQASRLTVLYGPSGVGKSSLLRAGVTHRLRADAESGRARHVVVACSSWQGDPLQAVADAVAAELSRLLGRQVQPEPDRALADQLEGWCDLLDGEIYLVLDQLEEYVLYHGADRGGPLAASLAEIVTRPSLRVGMLLGIRDDALADLDAFKARVPGLFGNLLRLDHLSRAGGRDAIVGPLDELSRTGASDVRVDDGLVEAVLDQVAAGRIVLGEGLVVAAGARSNGRIEAPYLQLVMERVWEIERGRGSAALRATTLDELGGARRVVEEHLGNALQALDGDQRSIAAAVFGFLVTPSGTKVAHRADDLARYAGVSVTQVVPVLDRLAEQRILRRVADDGGGPPRYEIFHDVLAPAIVEAVAQTERDRAIASERRRRRRAVAVAVAALSAAAVMGAVTLYALDQRSSAEQQAAAAEEAEANAERQAQAARAAQTEAEQAKRAAEQAEADAEEQAQQAQQAQQAEAEQAAAAEAASQEATEQSAAAEQSQQEAEAAQQEAEEQAQRATAEQARAAVAAATAERARVRAVRQARLAREAKQRANGDLLTARAAATMAADPERSLTLALRASALHPTAELEDVFRRTLLASRTVAIVVPGGAVRTVVYAPAGGVAAAAGDGGAVRLFDPATGRVGRTLRHGAPVLGLSFSPDGGTVAAVGRDGRATIWSTSTGALLRVVEQSGSVWAVAFSPDGRFLATGGAGQRVRVWETTNWAVVRDHEFPTAIRAIQFSPAGTSLLVVARDARTFDLTSGARIASFAHRERVTSASFSPDGRLVATGGEDDVASIWDASTGGNLHTLRGHRSNVRGVVFDRAGERLVTTGADSTTRVWDVDTGGVVDVLVGHELPVVRAAFSPDGATLLTASADGTATLWIQGGLFRTPLLGHRGPLTSAAFDPRGKTVLTGSLDGSVRIWHAGRIDPTTRVVAEHTGGVRAVEFGPGGTIVSGGVDGHARIWRNGRLVRALPHGGPVTDVSTPAGGLVLTGSQDGSARLWRLDGTGVRRMRHGAAVQAAAADAAGRLIVTAGADGKAALWEAPTGRPIRRFDHGAPLGSAAISPTGAYIATAGEDGVVKLWQTAGGTLVRTLRGHGDAVTAVAFSPDGRRLVTASRDADARVWAVPSGRRLALLSGHSAVVSDVQFSPDGRWIATAGPVTAGIWDARTGERLMFLRGHTSRVRSVAFGPDSRIVTAGDDGTIRSYRCGLCGRLPVLTTMARAQLDSVGRWLTPAERRRYLG